MIYPPEPFYVLDDITPRNDISLGRYNINMGIKTDFAMKFLDTELTDFAYNKLEELRNITLKSVGLINSKDHRYVFVKNKQDKTSWLLGYCHVEGNACDLGIEGGELDSIINKNYTCNLIEYSSHNVDSMQQSFALLSIWLIWANYACTNCIKLTE